MKIMSKEVELSARMQAIANLVTPGNVVCDVGCDHGFLSIYLVQNKISPRVIAMDVRSGPLSRCQEHVAQYGLEQYITMRLSDGLECLLSGEAETMVCAGMGGRLMQRILTEGEEKAAGLKELILQPQSELKMFRKFLRGQGYCTVEENMIEEDGKFYPMMKVVPASRVKSGQERSVCDRFGTLLLEKNDPVLYRFLKQREMQLLLIREGILTSSHTGARQRLCEIDSELADISEAFRYYEG
ncbi:MAG: SAM-dependent methyltransferase [Lachnospiraceae bacterium]|nr:SAM-dependent methyltransferase [Lachnospiraceae bacterium]